MQEEQTLVMRVAVAGPWGLREALWDMMARPHPFLGLSLSGCGVGATQACPQREKPGLRAVG